MKNFIFNKEVLPGKLRVIKEYGKFVTRRTQGLDEINKEPDKYICRIDNVKDGCYYTCIHIDYPKYASEKVIIVKPRYSVGERVFIREPFCNKCKKEYWGFKNCYKLLHYRYDKQGFEDTEYSTCIRKEWQSSYSMSEKEARHFGTVTSVRLERLQEITHQDCYYEGIISYLMSDKFEGLTCHDEKDSNIAIFHKLWNSLSKPPLTWEFNPFVFRYEVEVK